MSAEAGAGPRNNRQASHRKATRVAVRLDMTPMVDVAFLLLIFYMVTTMFRTPQALELSLPPDTDRPIPVAESKILTLRVLPGTGAEPRIFWSRGRPGPEEIRMADLSRILDREKSQVPDGFITLIKIDRSVEYRTMVRITDQLGLAGIDKFSLVPLSEEDRSKVAGL